MPLMAAHDLADQIEKAAEQKTGIALTVHIDPLVLDDENVNRLRREVEEAVAEIDPAFKVHDFRVVGGKTHANLIFDVAIPFDCPLRDEEVQRSIKERISLFNENVDAVATVERQNLD